MTDGTLKISSSNNPMVKKTVTVNHDEVRDLIKGDGARQGVEYFKAGGWETGEAKEGYTITKLHPKINDFTKLYNASTGGRRRPSRKYKKSKRVMRRKSRSTRRR